MDGSHLFKHRFKGLHLELTKKKVSEASQEDRWQRRTKIKGTTLCLANLLYMDGIINRILDLCPRSVTIIPNKKKNDVFVKGASSVYSYTCMNP